MSLVFVDSTPKGLRRHAEHCRELANSQADQRVRLILATMADEFDQQAIDLDAGRDCSSRNRRSGAD